MLPVWGAEKEEEMAVDGGRAFPRGEGEQEEIVEPYLKSTRLSLTVGAATTARPT